VTVDELDGGSLRPASCGAAVLPFTARRATALHPLP
jgi:hypothetical protein